MKPRVLVVDDELALAGILRCSLEEEGFAAAEAHDCEEALSRIIELRPDAIICDSTLPSATGFEAGRRMRDALNDRDVPIIMMTSADRSGECNCHLGGMIDDCIAKPFGIADLLTRLRSVMRPGPHQRTSKILSFADVTINLTTHRVMRVARSVHLGPTEFRLLWFFMEHPYRVFSRANLLRAIRGSNMGLDFDLRAVDVYVGRLRKALNVDGGRDIIRTVRSSGYAMDVEADALVGKQCPESSHAGVRAGTTS